MINAKKLFFDASGKPISDVSNIAFEYYIVNYNCDENSSLALEGCYSEDAGG